MKSTTITTLLTLSLPLLVWSQPTELHSTFGTAQTRIKTIPGGESFSASSVSKSVNAQGDDGISKSKSGGLAIWSESSVYVQRTSSLHPSRPSSFGPRISEDSLDSFLYPITSFSTSDTYGCSSSLNSTLPSPPLAPSTGWIALVERGHCPFSQKVRYAANLGAIAVLFGDESVEQGGLPGGASLLTPWSPDDTSDIDIPSAFVSRNTYLSIGRTWEDFQEERGKLSGLVVMLSQDEDFAWPLLDFLVLLLFLPSILTLLSVVTHRLRQLRQQKLDRAPRDIVARLPVFTWGETEKPVPISVPAQGEEESTVDEESTVGLSSSTPTFGREATETTSLLHPTLSSSSTSRSYFAQLKARLRSYRTSGGEGNTIAPSRDNSRFQTTECAICIEDFVKGDQVMQLPCGHMFHQEEIQGWLLESKRVCPVCRASITLDPSSASSPVAPLLPAAPLTPIVNTIPYLSTPTEDTTSPRPIPLVARDIERLATGTGTGAGASPVASSSSVTLEGLIK